MPRIIEAPIRSRRDSRGMTEEEVQAYLDLLVDLEEGKLVQVDESSSDNYEKSYAKGERVRTAAKKFELVPEGMAIKVVSFQPEEDGEFVAALALKSV